MSHRAKTPSRRYTFFILGLWQQPNRRPDDPAQWRIVLEDPRTSERTSFTTLAEFNTFLAGWMAERARKESDP